jgi:hypothetical protein
VHDRKTTESAAGQPQIEAICQSAVTQLLTIAREKTFAGADINYRRLLAEEGAQQSAMVIEAAVHELENVNAPSRMVHSIEVNASGFERLDGELHRRRHDGEHVAHAEYVQYDLLSERTERACGIDVSSRP